MKTSRTILAISAGTALVATLSFAYAQTNDPGQRPLNPATTAMPAEPLNRTNPAAPIKPNSYENGAVSKRDGMPINAASPSNSTSYSGTDSSVRTPVTGTDGSTMQTERQARRDRG